MADDAEPPELSLTGALNLGGLGPVAQWLDTKAAHEIAEELTRLNPVQSAMVWRMLPRDTALEIFEELDSFQQQQLLSGMRDQAFSEIVEEMDPDDRARLLGEAPAGFVRRVLAGLSHKERNMTASLLGFPEGSVGRVMSPEVVTVSESTKISDVLDVVRRKGSDAETIDLLAIVDRSRKLVGVVGLSHVVLGDPDLTVGEIADHGAPTIDVTEDAEKAARLVQETNRLGLMVVDSENRVLGVLTVDDALEVIEAADTEDIARQAGALPSAGHYLSDSVLRLARLRVFWLAILMSAATITVWVMGLFESALAEITALALFIPLLVGTGGNIAAQAATSAVRAVAVGEVRPGDAWRVAWRESRVGLLLGVVLGAIAFGAGWWVAGLAVAFTVGLSIVLLAVWATTVGSTMPLAAQALKIDPAVISVPLVTTLVDTSGLLIYFLVAGLVLSI